MDFTKIDKKIAKITGNEDLTDKVKILKLTNLAFTMPPNSPLQRIVLVKIDELKSHNR